MPIRLALVNDYEVVVRGLNSMLRHYRDDFAIVELNANTEVSEPVDIALFDVFAQSSGDGEDVHDLLANPVVNKVVVYGWNVTPAIARRAMDHGVAGYVSKTLPAHELVQALRAVHAGGRVVSGNGSKRAVIGGDWPGREEGLTAREAEVIALITQGLSNSDIAEPLLALDQLREVLHPQRLPQDRRHQSDQRGPLGRRARLPPRPGPHRRPRFVSSRRPPAPLNQPRNDRALHREGARSEGNNPMVVLGLILLILGLLLPQSILVTIGLILIVVGLILNFVPIGGSSRRVF